MSLKIIFFGILFFIASIVDLALGTASSPKLLIIVCAIVMLYESISPYVYTPR
jgi:hypothetical protein